MGYQLILSLLMVMVSIATAQDPTSGTITEITFSFEEEQKSGYIIGTISASAKIDVTTGSSFKITTKDQTLVKITNETTGELRTAQVIDREVVCRNEISCEKVIQVVSVVPYEILTVKLIIEDINDQRPDFGKTTEEMTLSESQAPGTFRPLPLAIDLDKGPGNGVEVYEFSFLSDDTSKFELVLEKNQQNVTTGLKLQLIDKLDREVTDHYTLVILAKDNGEPKRTGTLTVDITVSDENDNVPVFDDPVVNISITEDITVGKVIYTFRAKDNDTGKNGEVEYLLDQLQSNYILQHFAVNQTTGELSVTSKLEYEAGNSQKTVYIVATDKGENPETSTATLFLTIKDVDNNAPEISATVLVDGLRVSEKTPVSTAILHVSVTDSDTGVDGQVECNMYNTYFGLEKVQAVDKNYKVFVQSALDRESIPEHNITISCRDGGGLEAFETFTVTVTDENDHTPLFSQFVYYVNVTENNNIGAEILTVSATDKDIDENGRISYKLLPNPDFEIDENTGIIKAKTQLDYESHRRKIFDVFAVDNSKVDQRTGTATVQINILDINDNAPDFTATRYAFRIREGLGSNALVDMVTAIDGDSGDAGRVSYDISLEYKTGGPLAVPFIIVGDGEIKTTMDLDREQKSEYVFKVVATDLGSPRLSSIVDVHVFVDDANDQTPVFVFPSENNKTVTALNEVSDVPIAELGAVDNDTGINQELIYFIADGDVNSVFSLEPNSGNLYIVKYVHLKEDTTFHLIVSVYDKGTPPLSAKSELIVNLQYANVTTTETLSDVNKSYVIIVVTVVIVTCLLSVTIITVICLIRRKDVKEGGNHSRTSKLKLPSISGKLSGSKPSSSQQLASDKIYPTDTIQQKNKKEVSFSFEDGDSLSINDLRQLTVRNNKDLYSSRQSTLHEMPEESGYELDIAPPGILHPPKPYPPPPHTKLFDPVDHDVQLNGCHQREDSHSETSGETTTSHDSGKGNSVDGDNHDLKFDTNQVNRIIYQTNSISSPLRSSARTPSKPLSPNIQPSRTSIRDSLQSLKIQLPHNTSVPLQQQARKWSGQNLDINGSYPESDYVSMSSNMNNSQSHIMPYRDDLYTYNSNPNSANQTRTPQVPKNYCYYNPEYSDVRMTFRSNSVREDDETTTTSGSYTINHDDVDDDLAYRYQTSQVV